MSIPAYEARAQLDSYARQLDPIISRKLIRLSEEELALISTIQRAVSEFLLEAAASLHADPALVDLIPWAHLLQRFTAQLLAVAGLDATWGDASSDQMVLTGRESALVVDRLLDSPEPNDYLRFAARRYRAITGR